MENDDDDADDTNNNGSDDNDSNNPDDSDDTKSGIDEWQTNISKYPPHSMEIQGDNQESTGVTSDTRNSTGVSNGVPEKSQECHKPTITTMKQNHTIPKMMMIWYQQKNIWQKYQKILTERLLTHLPKMINKCHCYMRTMIAAVMIITLIRDMTGKTR